MSEPVIAAFIGAAATQLGRFYPGVSPYGQWYDEKYGGGKGVYDNGQFCAMGLSWAADRAGIPTDVFPPHAYTPSGAAWFRQRGRFTKGVAGIRRGDIWYSSCAGLGRISHVGLVESVNADGSFNTLEFNTAGTYEGDQRNGRMVARKRRNTACSLGGYGRPAYPGTVGALRPGTGSAFTPDPTPSEEDDMPLDAKKDYPAFAEMLQRALYFDIRPNGLGATGANGPTIFEQLAAIQAAAGSSAWNTLFGHRYEGRNLIDRLRQLSADVYAVQAKVGTESAPVPAIDIDEAELARELAPLLTASLGSLSDEDVKRLADAVADEHAKRLKG